MPEPGRFGPVFFGGAETLGGADATAAEAEADVVAAEADVVAAEADVLAADAQPQAPEPHVPAALAVSFAGALMGARTIAPSSASISPTLPSHEIGWTSS
jgi:hypothetical protein